MNTQAWLDLWQDKLLREYICDLAAACSRLTTVQEDLIATAWLAIGECQCDASVECVMNAGGLALVKRYRAAYYVPLRKWHAAPVRRRIWRSKRKFFIKVDHPPAKVCDNVT